MFSQSESLTAEAGPELCPGSYLAPFYPKSEKKNLSANKPLFEKQSFWMAQLYLLPPRFTLAEPVSFPPKNDHFWG